MKKLLCLFMTLCLVLTACGGPAPAESVSTESESVPETESPEKGSAPAPDVGAESSQPVDKDGSVPQEIFELLDGWQSWPALAESGAYVFCDGFTGTANLELLEDWLAEYENGGTAKIDILYIGNPAPLVWRLSCDGGGEYTAARFMQAGVVSYTANEVIEREADYVFGAAKPENLKSPFWLPKRSVVKGEHPAESLVLDGLEPEAAIEISRAAHKNFEAMAAADCWSRRMGTELPGGASPAHQELIFEIDSLIDLDGKPCYMVVCGGDAAGMAEGHYAATYAVATDGSAIYVPEAAYGNYGGWLLFDDVNEREIKP